MKKHRAFLLILLCIFCFIALTGCQGDGYTRERFYGVVHFSEELNRAVIYVPEIGDVEIPEYEQCTADFDGHEENGNGSYTLKTGDFVAIHFKYKTGWDENSVKIMECYPARFDRKANAIEALMENIAFEKVENGYTFSFPPGEEIKALSVGDTVYFVHHGGKNGVAYRGLLAEGILTHQTERTATVRLTMKISEKEFFEKLTSIHAESAWGE